MADIHVLTIDGNVCRLVMHFAVPNQPNDVDVNYRTALVNSGIGGSTIMVEGTEPGQIDMIEAGQIATGALYEHIAMIDINGVGQSTEGRRAMLRAQYIMLKAAVIASLQGQLKFFGHTESEA